MERLRERGTDGVAGSEFLLCGHDGATTLGLVQGSFATDDGLAGGGPAPGLAANLRDGIPVV